MKSISQLKFPKNLRQVVEAEGLWETEAFDPIIISVLEFEHIGQDLLGYQMEFEPVGKVFEPVNQVMRDRGIDPDGEEWEALILRFVRGHDRGLSDSLNGNSEPGTCAIWTSTEEGFRHLLALCMSLLDNPVIAKDYLSV